MTDKPPTLRLDADGHSQKLTTQTALVWECIQDARALAQKPKSTEELRPAIVRLRMSLAALDSYQAGMRSTRV